MRIPDRGIVHACEFLNMEVYNVHACEFPTEGRLHTFEFLIEKDLQACDS
jgi:hypothetical protein